MGHTHRYKFDLEKKIHVKTPSIWSRTPNSVRIRQSGRTGNRGVTTYSCISDLILVLRILHGAYSDTKVPVGTTEILWNVYWYCRTYSCIFDLIRVLRNLYMYFRPYTCLTKHILVLRILYLFYRTYSCLTDLILVRRYP